MAAQSQENVVGQIADRQAVDDMQGQAEVEEPDTELPS